MLAESRVSKEAIERAVWLVRYVVDGLGDDADAHPGVRGHLIAARVQLEAALTLAATGRRQRVE
jgi:hypothetical protein